MPHRLLISIVVAGLALCAATAAPAAGRPTVERGQALHIAVKVQRSSVCAPTVRYSDGTSQFGATKKAPQGRLSWTLLVPKSAPLGPGTWILRCGASVARHGSFVIVAGKTSTGTVDVPRIVVDKQGYSQRNDPYGAGSKFSFGLFLRNTSETQDALNVYVLVNMVAASGELVGTMTRTVSIVSPSQTFAFGDSMQLRSQVPVARLELTIRVGAHQPKQLHNQPEFANLGIFSQPYDPGWVAEVDGEVLNSTVGQTLSSSRISIVVLDAAGTVVGGGTGSSYSPLPYGSRMVFIANSGFSAIPLDHAATAVVSSEPTYQPS